MPPKAAPGDAEPPRGMRRRLGAPERQVVRWLKDSLSLIGACVFLQNVVSARPSTSAASTQAPSALRMQPRRTNPLRGGPTAGSLDLWGLNGPVPGLGVRQHGASA